ncbi:MAG: hypothetical protein A2V69_00830 [Candidatus Portnoybacteria bacterium RBG_13_40_8]|uniref:EamA domain-containing protein n=1 Tax=Candidatus Portnoybacteria bacterium RBG_13_40_8 TaxID=1801990 RepID=A0A1G2F474_9BACT|nr:MAG: hypothetical protein A2V69_00830 [Candidatus Portnoybacteria bacterium RBG_13_40_8]OGZ34509.1 MAG: hypothetical protein A2V60_03000 [Candidatus Portnoybacteria bacterium RIFCSPHIGHO2_01_FULL_39_19]
MKKGILLVLLTAIISGFSIFINQFGVSVINPYVFTGLKNIVVAVMLGCLLLAMKERRLLKDLKKKQWLLLLVIGLIGGSIPFLLFFKGLFLTTAAQGSFIHKTMFIYVMVFATLFFKERINKKLLFGGLFLLLGNAFLLKFIPHSLSQGDLLILLATLFWAVENIISKHVLKELPPRIVAWGRMFFGSAFILIFLVITGQVGLIININSNQIIWVLVTSVLLFGYVMTWYSGLKHMPVSLATTILLLGAPITTLLTFISTGIISRIEILGAGLILVGVILILKLIYKIKPQEKKLCQD